MSFQLTTKHLLLKTEDSSKAEDVLDFYIRNKQLFEMYEPTRPNNFYTLSYQTAAMNYEYAETIKGKTLRYYVYEKSNPKTIIGSVNFTRIEHGPFCKTTIGYKFDFAYHKKGYAFEACQAAINIIFTNYKIHRIEARVGLDNTPSIRLLERLGFRFEGIEYESVEVNGSFKDHYRYSLLAPAIETN